MAKGAVGECRACGYSPVAVDAKACPRCGARSPNPSVADRYVGPGMLYGMGAGAAAGSAAGYLSGAPGMLCGGALLGAIPGLAAGVAVSLLVALVRRPSGGK